MPVETGISTPEKKHFAFSLETHHEDFLLLGLE